MIKSFQLKIASLTVAGIFFTHATAAPQRYEFVAPHMGTLWRLVFFHHDEKHAQAARDAAWAKVQDVENALTDYRSNSEAMQLCQHSRAEKPTTLFLNACQLSLRLATETDGAFDPTVGPLVQLWRNTRKIKKLPSPSDLSTARQRVGYQHLIINDGTLSLARPEMQLDFGAIGKGYAQDEVVRVLREKFALTAVMLDAGGGVIVGDPPPGEKFWRVHVPSPQTDHSGLTLHLTNTSIATSGDKHQWIEIDGLRYSHIIDPQTALGLTEGTQATVISASAARADALATALCVRPALVKKLAAAATTDAFIIFSPHRPEPVVIGETAHKALASP